MNEDHMTTNEQVRDKEVWIALLLVHQRPGARVLMDENDAYVQTLALASSTREYEKIVRDTLGERGFDVVEIEDPEPLSERMKSWTVDPSLLSIASQVEKSGEVGVGPFVVWSSDE
jgi:hypothetical protein